MTTDKSHRCSRSPIKRCGIRREKIISLKKANGVANTAVTEQELEQIPFHMTAHVNGAKEHTLTYADESGDLGFCDHTKVKENGGYAEYGRTYRHWRIKNKIYKSYKKFLEALKDYDARGTRT